MSLEGVVLLDVQVCRRTTYLVMLGFSTDCASLDLLFEFDEVAPPDSRDTRRLAIAFRSVQILALPCGKEHARSTLPGIPLPSERGALLDAVERTAGVKSDVFVTAFESLGHSCDFGLFQRECGAEPLGLLRFGGISTPDLVAAIIERFAQLGFPQNLAASVRHGWRNEYSVVDSAYGLVSHTFVQADQAAPEQLVAREVWRLPFLRRLFLEVLDGALKIFVLRRPDDMHVSEALAVAAALRLHGNNVLLWAVQDGCNSPGSVEVIAPYLLRGHLDGTLGKGSASIQAWLSICMNSCLALNGSG